jgi:hypothetical protein
MDTIQTNRTCLAVRHVDNFMNGRTISSGPFDNRIERLTTNRLGTVQTECVGCSQGGSTRFQLSYACAKNSDKASENIMDTACQLTLVTSQQWFRHRAIGRTLKGMVDERVVHIWRQWSEDRTVLV